MASTIHYIGRIAVSEVEDRIIYMLFKIMFDYYMDTGCKFAYKHFKVLSLHINLWVVKMFGMPKGSNSFSAEVVIYFFFIFGA